MTGKTRPVPVRFTADNDAFIQEWMKDLKLNNRNQAVNDIVDYAKNLWWQRKNLIERYAAELKLNRIRPDELKEK